MFVACACLFLVLAFTEAGKLPSYMHQCRRGDPDLSECITKNANIAMTYIAKGDRAYKIPDLQPFEVNEIITEPGPNLKVVMKDVKVYGMDKTNILKSTIDLKKKTLSLRNNIPVLTILGDYQMSGRILILPIQGKGRSNISIENAIYHYDIEFDIEKSKKDSKEYIKIIKDSMTYVPEKISYNFENLFNGDRRLGPEMNRFMNENWRDVDKDLNGGVGATMGAVITSILNAIFKTVPYEDIFP